MHTIRSHARWRTVMGLLCGLALALVSCDESPIDIEFPTPIDDHWWGGFDAQGLNDYVYVLGEFEGDLVAGGLFTTAGTAAARSIARWNGSSWSAFGDGMERDGCTGTVCMPWVSALTTFQGDLVAGGRFTAAGGAPAANIARWNGTEWSPLGDGFDDTVFALAEYRGELVAGGIFTRSGADTTVRYLARWDGAAWKSFGGGTNDAVRALLVRETELVVGGDFTRAGADSAGYVAIWDGQSWTMPAPFLNRRVRAATLFGDQLVLSGDFYRTQDGSVWFEYVGSWDGSRWRNFDNLGGDATALCVYRGQLVVGGSFSRSYNSVNRIARWDGRSWIGLGSGLDRYVTSVAAHDGHLYAGGWFRLAGNKSSRYIARWDDVLLSTCEVESPHRSR